MEMETENTFLLVSFSLGGTWYGLEASLVQEVIPAEGSTYVYHAPPYVHGIINLRGKIVTVIDLQIKIGLEAQQSDEENPIESDDRILIISWNQEQIGLLVDSVAEVISLEREQIEEPPPNITEELRLYLSGVYQGEGLLIGILDMEKVLAVETSRT